MFRQGLGHALVMGIALAAPSGAAFANALPENNLQFFPVGGTSDITEEEFETIIQSVAELYRTSIEGHGARMVLEIDWADNTVNAYASQAGKDWIVKVYGGIARDPYMTRDGLSFIVCHEFGHHLAGFPFRTNGYWAASEGQSDYFASHVCAKDLWKSETEKNATFRDKIAGFGKEQCDAAWSSEEGQNLCYRSALAALPMAAITSRIYKTNEPSIDRFDPKEVEKTSTLHPDGQCRLDTAVQGGSCLTAFDLTIIPGLKFGEGQNSLGAEEQAALFSCLRASDHTVGLRPRCWFKPRL